MTESKPDIAGQTIALHGNPIQELQRLADENDQLRKDLKIAIWSDREECKMLEAQNKRLRTALAKISKAIAALKEEE